MVDPRTHDERPGRDRRRLLLWGGAGSVLALGAAAGWLAWTGQQARGELLAAKASLPAVQAAVLAGDGSAARQLDALRRHAAAAADDTHDPLWSLAGALPLVGSPFATTSGLTGAVDELARQGLPALARAADTLHPAQLLNGKGKLDVAGLQAAAPALAQAATSLREQRDAVARLDPSWFGPVSAAHAELLGELRDLAGTSRDAASAAQLLPPMLGVDGPRRYFVAFQNPAEARGTGGLLDAFAVVLADKGAVRIERMGANTELPRFTGSVDGDVDQAFSDRYSAVGGTSAWLEGNVSPNFPDVAAAWEGMWTRATGQRLDGAIALDPKALSAVLDATGPVQAPVVGTVDARRIEPLVLRDQYTLGLGGQRKSLMLGVGGATVNRLLGGGVSPRRLLPQLRDVAGSGHVMVHSRVPDEERRLVEAGVGGAVDGTDGPFAQAVVVNAAGNKLDTWLDSSLHYAVTSCGPRGRTVDVTVTVRNQAPTSGLPPYMTVRSDRPPYPTVTGQNRSEIDVLVTRGATLLQATLDGAQVLRNTAEGTLPADVDAEAADAFLGTAEVGGRPSYWLDLETRPGASHTLVLRLAEPPSTRAPVLPRQNLVRPPTVSADVGTCGG